VLRFRADVEQRATNVELFFDLVFVFAITQLATRLKDDLSFGGAGRALFLLLVVWWAWIYTTWMTNWFDPEHLSVRLVLIACMLAAFLMAIAIPDAFGSRAPLFAGGYFALQIVRNTFVVLKTDDSEPMRRSWVRMWIGSLWVGAIWIAGALVPDDGARAAIWVAALVLDYGGPLAGFWAPGLGRTEVTEWELEHGHFVERFQTFVIIALGETLVATGTVASRLDLTAERVLAIAVAFLGTTVFWWLYFDEVAERSRAQLAAAGPKRGELARDAFTYLHVPIVAGILVTAVGDALVIAHPGDPLHGEKLVAMLSGPVLYVLGHVAFELRMTGSVAPTRVGAGLIVVALAPLGTMLPVVVTWALVYGTLTVVAGLETYARLWGRPEGAPRRGWPLAERPRHLPALRLRRVLK
jgi:low temperature requirement protein LtrA